jgi:hypothetical protein
MPSDRLAIARDCYRAYEDGDRSLIEPHLAPGFTFFSPADPGIDRDRYFERCWPNAELLRSFRLVRLFEHEDDVVVTYEAERHDGTRFRNTEILSFESELVARVEVYFGWNLS